MSDEIDVEQRSQPRRHMSGSRVMAGISVPTLSSIHGGARICTKSQEPSLESRHRTRLFERRLGT